MTESLTQNRLQATGFRLQAPGFRLQEVLPVTLLAKTLPRTAGQVFFL